MATFIKTRTYQSLCRFKITGSSSSVAVPHSTPSIHRKRTPLDRKMVDHSQHSSAMVGHVIGCCGGTNVPNTTALLALHYITFLGSFLFCWVGNSPPTKNIQPTAVLWSETDTDEGLEDSKDFCHSPFSSDCQCHSNEKCNAVSQQRLRLVSL